MLMLPRTQKYKSNQENLADLYRYTNELNTMIYDKLRSDLGFHRCPVHLQERLQALKMCVISDLCHDDP